MRSTSRSLTVCSSCSASSCTSSHECPHDLNEEQLDQAMTTSHERGESLSGFCQRDSGVGLVCSTSPTRQRLDHVGRGSGCDVEGDALAHREQALRWLQAVGARYKWL